MELQELSSHVIDIPDYPEPGVVFKDITPLFTDSHALATVIDALAEHFRGAGITKVIAPEARGFLVGAPVAYKLGAGFVPARKPGKLPRETISASYELEYGTDSIEIHRDALTADDRVIILDDLIATGGTAKAVASLVDRQGAKLIGYGCILELSFLHPRDVLAPEGDIDVYSLLVVE